MKTFPTYSTPDALFSEAHGYDSDYHQAGKINMIAMCSLTYDVVACLSYLLDPSEVDASMELQARGGMSQYRIQLSGYIFWAVASSPYIRRAIDFALVSIYQCAVALSDYG